MKKLLPFTIILAALFSFFSYLYSSKNSPSPHQARIAIVDTGIDLKQRTLTRSMVSSYNLTSPEESLQDYNGHGTQIASVITHLAPKVEIIIIKAIPKSGVTTKETLAQAITKSVDMGAEIINISSGISSPSPILERAVLYAEKNNTIIVAAAGDNNSSVFYPAAYPSVIAVGAIDSNGKKLPNSNTGPELDLVALGEYKTIGLGGECHPGIGTSLATPVVSAYLANIAMGYDAKQKNDELISTVKKSLLDIRLSEKHYSGKGFLFESKIELGTCNP